MGWRIFQNSSAASTPPKPINRFMRYTFLLCTLLALSSCVSHPRYTTKPITQKPAEKPKPKSEKPKSKKPKSSEEKKDKPITISDLPIDLTRIQSKPHQIGYSSYYAHKFHGRQTANGEIFDMNGLSAAHRELPLGTIIRVTHLGNGKSVTLKVNDRGPFVEGRILDLSLGAARELEMIEAGVAKVMIEIVKPVD
jgi:rare lipoprotein A